MNLSDIIFSILSNYLLVSFFINGMFILQLNNLFGINIIVQFD